MSILSHSETRDPRNRSRKKPTNGPLELSVTNLGPNRTLHIEAVDWYEEYSYPAGDGTYTETYAGRPVVLIPTLDQFDGVEDDLSDTRKAALNKALDKLKDQRINLAVAIGELPETVGFLYNGAKALIDSFKVVANKQRALKATYERMRRGAKGKNPKRKRQATNWLRKSGTYADQVAGLWLGWRYGVMPLVYDMQGAYDEYNRPQEGVGDIINVKTSKRYNEFHKIPEFMDILVSGSSTLPPKAESYLEVDVTYSVVLNVVVEKPRSATQLGFGNGPQLLWELTPLSFVLDWGINLGESLGALDAGTGTSFISGTISEKRLLARRVKGDTISFTAFGNHSSHITYSDAESYDKVYERTVLEDLPLPQFYTSNGMDKKRWLDAFALLKVIVLKTKL